MFMIGLMSPVLRMVYIGVQIRCIEIIVGCQVTELVLLIIARFCITAILEYHIHSLIAEVWL